MLNLFPLLQAGTQSSSQINDLAQAVGEELAPEGAEAFLALLAALDGAEPLVAQGATPAGADLLRQLGQLASQDGKILPPGQNLSGERGGNLMPLLLQAAQSVEDEGEGLDMQQLQQMRALLQQMSPAGSGQDAPPRELNAGLLQQMAQAAQGSERSQAPQSPLSQQNILNWQHAEPAQPVGRQLMQMVQQGQQQARLHIHPEHLGTIDIRLRMDGDSAQVTFSAPNAQVREVLEQSLPRLREMFAESGLDLADAGVDAGSGEQAPDAGPQTADVRNGADDDGTGEQQAVSLHRPGPTGLLDTFA